MGKCPVVKQKNQSEVDSFIDLQITIQAKGKRKYGQIAFGV